MKRALKFLFIFFVIFVLINNVILPLIFDGTLFDDPMGPGDSQSLDPVEIEFYSSAKLAVPKAFLFRHNDWSLDTDPAFIKITIGYPAIKAWARLSDSARQSNERMEVMIVRGVNLVDGRLEFAKSRGLEKKSHKTFGLTVYSRKFSDMLNVADNLYITEHSDPSGQVAIDCLESPDEAAEANCNVSTYVNNLIQLAYSINSKHLDRWREQHRRILELVRTFIVESPN